MRRNRLGWQAAAAVLLLPIVGAVALHQWHRSMGAELGTLLLVLNLSALGGMLLLAGQALAGDPFGFALSGLNRYSLARAQVALWTVVVFAALLTTAEWNLALPASTGKGPLDVAIPTPLLSALGIALFSGVAASVITVVRGDTTDDASGAQMDAAATRTQALLGKPADLVAKGQVIANRTCQDASWKDLLSGDDVPLAGAIDLSKVQQAMLTLIVVGIYLAAYVEALQSGAQMSSLPQLGEDAVRLLAISHVGYLAFKAAPKPDAAVAGQGRSAANRD